jgi:hypothetical protein
MPEILLDVALFNVLAPLALLWFVDIFTTPLPPEPEASTQGSKETEEQSSQFADLKRRWMIFAYGFMIYSMVLAIYPFMVDHVPESPREYRRYADRIVDAPISVLRGCVEDGSDRPSTLACRKEGGGGNDEEQLSWLIQAGAQVKPLKREAPPKAAAFLQPFDALRTEVDAAGNEVDPALKDVAAAMSEVRIKLDKLGPIPSRSASEYTASAGALRQAVADLKAQVEQSPPSDQEKLAKLKLRLPGLEAAANAYMSKAAAYANSAGSGEAGFVVSGGLVIPLYLVILSLMGGAISLTRRIPEYQKSSEPGYVPTEKEPALTRDMLREYLIFQIVQFLSAPLIAAVAYYVIEPSTTAATVGLAFAAGFASETVLLWVRAVVEKLAPVRPPGVKAGSVVGRVTMGGTPADKATAVVLGAAGPPAETGADGSFVLNGVPAGDWAVEVTKVVGAATLSAVKRLKVEPERSTYLEIQLTAQAAAPTKP